MNEGVSLDHLNLTVKNFEESVRWYNRVFGFELVEQGIEDGSPWGVIRSQDSMLCIYEDSERIPLASDEKSDRFHQIFHFGLKVKSGSARADVLLKEKLRTFYGSPIRYPHSTSWYVKDPSGYMIEVALWDENQVHFPPGA